ncbi:Protein AGENET DOMAIN (AGD)-CONTAINING P1 [Camellia lanceoleosa]|uniref:Protein AGENET DOMAIN (AGD)-CONTAINING P1 n=1 Tax=Camellia lanceoleosa TaxID=1840588 RepID=A0ACC0FY21_9ERIC|nr:Protein AGENET DOMAIN (AGD)-CONTAINING P1 [Camellia lanceoleosa]
MGDSEEEWLKKGAEVEVSFEDEGFRGSWYTATVLRTVSKKNNKIFVEFHSLMADDRGSKPLREFVNVILVRPVPPRELTRTFKLSEEVDAFHNDGWWEGIVTAILQDSRYSVFFRSSREQIDFPDSDLRLHREWVHGIWVPPLEQQPPPPPPQEQE